MWEVRNSNLGSETGYLEGGFSFFSKVPQKHTSMVPHNQAMAVSIHILPNLLFILIFPFDPVFKQGDGVVK
jgi:hypothetical protein